MKHQLLFFFIAISTFFSCTDPGENGAPGGDSGKGGYLVGKVVDQQGKGVAGATVFTENTVFKGRGAEVTTKADGSYQMAVVEGLGQWIVDAYTLVEYNGRVYKMRLHPENTESFSVEEKPVRNFEWKIQGRLPDKSLNLYYGGSAELYADPNSEIRSEDVEFTFRPDGPLIDGASGKVLKLSGGKSGSNNHNRIDDIPIGRYRVTAVHKLSGQPLRVGDAWDGDDYYESVTMEFKGTEASYRANQMGLAFTDR
ncbi:hypothetical protein SAMN04487996_11246 [Dyadobacter soli]|uniref:Carboxypeptidase regulatory-like domain-containing protein n=1 Tax=Dyadobacter soli TaxID=659014 RepID=A0A1G7NG25_9BACT|nr:carboxypeptidase-like regulatory domain-containing protein [Dyadobacter soli]SDF73045.1 hypothetical protein SAMN04487996_11246 [Dyadobacter soli]